MSDPRPSENQDQPLQLDEMRRRGFFDEVPLIDYQAADETKDHKAEAEEILARRGSPNDPNGLAVAHALLALVEQQRIANLIALAEHAHARFGNHAGEAGGMRTLFVYPETEHGHYRLRPEIREGLGL